jgi:ketosteroid isomerase-like protein
MTMRICVLLVTVFSFCGFAAAQSGPCTVAGVKAAKVAAAKGMLPHTADLYVFTGAVDEPVIGAQAVRRATATIRASRKNESQVERTERMVADASGGMAYEYGTLHLSYDDVKTGEHEELTAAYLFVWKADGGACKVAAEMSEPENTNQPSAKN